MKKIFLTLFLLLFTAIPTLAEKVMPDKTDLKNTRTIGVYQVSNEIVLHKDYDENSDVIKTIKWNKNEILPENLTFHDVFVVFIPNKSLALMQVTDETEDWVEVIYNNTTGEKGWLKKDDPYKFATWTNFYNMYGKKYGLYILKGAPECVKNMKSSPDKQSQTVDTMNFPSKINLNVIRGNWALVSILDMDKTSKTGYIKWRSDDGVKYLFPDIK